jgi:predicted small lipoprotein YifL
MKSSTKYLSLVGLVLSLAACGTPQQMPDMETSDAAADSQQMIQEDSSRAADVVSEETTSSPEDSSVESDASDSGANISDSSDSSTDSGSLVREPNVVYRIGESVIEINRNELLSYLGDGGANFVEYMNSNYGNCNPDLPVARIQIGSCTLFIPRQNVDYWQHPSSADASAIGLKFHFSINSGDSGVVCHPSTEGGMVMAITPTGANGLCTGLRNLTVYHNVRVE